MVPVLVGGNQVNGKNLSHVRRQSDEFKRIVNVQTVGVKPSWDAVPATLLEYRQYRCGNILREGFDRPCSTDLSCRLALFSGALGFPAAWGYAATSNLM